MKWILPLLFILLVPISYATLENDLLHWMKFEDGNDSITSQYQWFSNESGTPVKQTGIADGLGYNLSDATDGLIAFSSMPTDPFSICGWFNGPSDTVPEIKTLLDVKSTARAGGETRDILAENSGALRQMRCRMRNSGGGQVQGFDPTQWTAGADVHFCCVWNGTHIATYRDGTWKAAGAITTTQDPDKEVYLGRSVSGSYDFDGLVDEWGYWNRSLTNSEISQLAGGTTYPFADNTPPTNSSWSVSSNNVIPGQDIDVWATDGRWEANVTSNLLSITVTTSENTNMSCALDEFGANRNYTEIINNNSAHKAATTETTSHSFTVVENISTDNHCLYCAFVDGSNNGAESGCLNISRVNYDTHIDVSVLNITGFSFSSTDYVTIISETVNFTFEQDAVLLSSFDLQKTTGTAADIYGRVSIDGKIQSEELVRSISSTNTYGSSGLRPIKYNFSGGGHNLTVEFRSSTIGNVEFTNVDFIILKTKNSESSGVFDVNLTNISVTDTGSEFERVVNFTFKRDPSSEVFFNTYITALGIGSNSIIDGLIKNTKTNSWKSNLYSRSLTVGQVGTINTPHVTPCVCDEYSLVNRVSAGSVFLNGTILSMAMRDNSSWFVANGQFINTTTNITNTKAITGNNINLANISILSNTSDDTFISFSVSASSTTGSQTPVFWVNGTNCSLSKFRTFTSDRGVVYGHTVCEAGNGINDFILYANVSAGESLTVYDESLSGFTVQVEQSVTVNLPPVPSAITNPTNGSVIQGKQSFTWLEFFDPNGNLAHYNLSILNSDMSINTILGNTSKGELNWSINVSAYSVDTYFFNVEGVDTTGLSSNSSSQFTVSNRTIGVNLSLPTDGSIDGDGLINFSFITDTQSNCTLIVNSTNNYTVEGVGLLSFPIYNETSNTTLIWYVTCTDSSATGSSASRQVLTRIVGSLSSRFTVGSCPSGTDNVILFGIFVLIALVLLFMGLISPIFGIFGGIMLVILGFLTISCYLSLSLAIIFIGALSILTYLAMGWSK